MCVFLLLLICMSSRFSARCLAGGMMVSSSCGLFWFSFIVVCWCFDVDLDVHVIVLLSVYLSETQHGGIQH